MTKRKERAEMGKEGGKGMKRMNGWEGTAILMMFRSGY